MKIKDERLEQFVLFEDLDGGDFFYFKVGDTFGIKVDNFKFSDLPQDLYVNVLTGELTDINSKVLVTPLTNAAVVVK